MNYISGLDTINAWNNKSFNYSWSYLLSLGECLSKIYNFSDLNKYAILWLSYLNYDGSK